MSLIESLTAAPVLAAIDWMEVLLHPGTLGFGAGLVLTFFVWKGGISARSSLKRENKRIVTEMKEMQGHLNTQLKINAAGNDKVEKQIEELKETNETLRVNIAALQSKPGKMEVRQLHLTERAVSLMREQAPGFASAWEQAMRQAEAEQEAAESGLRKLVRRVLPSIGTTATNHAEESYEAEEAESKS